MSSTPGQRFGMWSGAGLVVANMVGAGVFLSSGFMAQNLTAGQILLAWVMGLALALAGTVAYAEVARLVPRGGGEYRYLSTLLHPVVGNLAGWASLLLGFSAPIALDAIAAGAFAQVVFPSLDPRTVAAVLIIALSVAHSLGLESSRRIQDVLVSVKVALLVGFVVVGVARGSLAWPTWTPPEPAAAPVDAMFGSLFFIAFAFSGWNAAVYAADEFRNPTRDVPRAMLIGCTAVGLLYLAVNYLFVANLTPDQSLVVTRYSEFTQLKAQYQQVTLGQAVMARILGDWAAQAMSAVMLVLFASAMSAMMLVGPRVYAAMAGDGVLPAFLKARPGRPPTGAVLLQGAISLGLLYSNDARTVLYNVGAILVLFAALTMAGLFVAARTARTPEQRPSTLSLLAATLYVVTSTGLLARQFLSSASLLAWVGAVVLVAAVAWLLGRRRLAAP